MTPDGERRRDAFLAALKAALQARGHAEIDDDLSRVDGVTLSLSIKETMPNRATMPRILYGSYNEGFCLKAQFREGKAGFDVEALATAISWVVGWRRKAAGADATRT